jgi:hypothetical protein
MPCAGTLTLAYDAPTRTFTATVTAFPGFTPMSVQLTSPGGLNVPLSSTSPGSNPSTWTYTFPPVQPHQPDPVVPGTWIAVAVLQGIGTATGAVNV